MKTRALLILFSAAGLLFAGCTSITTGPASLPANDTGVRPLATEPQPAPIPKKNIPSDTSSLKKNGPDQPLYP